MTLSRLDSEGFVKNLHYAAAYWEEHGANFREMVNRLLEEATIQKIAANASSLALAYNHQKSTIPPQYNQKVIFPAYEVLEQRINKTMLCDALDAYMQIIASMGERTIPLDELFSSNDALQKMNFFCETCLGEGYDKEACGKYFLPQLLLYFLRFLDIYDNAVKGCPMDSYLEELKRMQMESRMKDDNKVKQLWEKMKKQKEEQEKITTSTATAAKQHQRTDEAKGKDKEKIEDEEESSEDKEQEEHVNRLLENISIFSHMKKDKQERQEQLEKRMGAKNEVHFLEKSALKGRELLIATWEKRSDEFLSIWEGLSIDKRRELLTSTRNFLLTMGGGSYASAVLYCPELHVDDLVADSPSIASKGQSGITLINLIQLCLADPAEHPDKFAENFLAPLAKKKLLETQYENEKQRKEQEQEVITMATMITASRRFILLTFVCKVLSEVLDIPFDELAPATSLLAPLKATESENVRGMLFKQTPDLRVCSNPDCTNQETKEKTFLVCSLCRKVGLSVPYCSRGCQAKDWPEHKRTCGVVETAAAGRNQAGGGAKIEELVETKRPQERLTTAEPAGQPSKASGQSNQAEQTPKVEEVWERVTDSSLANID